MTAARPTNVSSGRMNAKTPTTTNSAASSQCRMRQPLVETAPTITSFAAATKQKNPKSVAIVATVA